MSATAQRVMSNRFGVPPSTVTRVQDGDLDDRRDKQERPGFDAVEDDHCFLTRTMTESARRSPRTA